VNPNGVDTDIFCPKVNGSLVREELGIGKDEIVVGFSGTFGEWHGIPTLSQALPMVIATNERVRWLLLGDGSLRGIVDQAVEDHALGERVLRVGMLPHAVVPKYLAACDILVSPHARQADGGEFFGSPTKLYEYMAMGRPIVASRVGQIGEVLRDEESALLVPPDDANALSQAIVRLVEDPCLRTKLGCAARAAAEREYTWRHNAERVLESLQTW
jgi:glycosyltransferase involved in cell wall biosynthesis